MRKIFALLLFSLLFSIASFAQTPTPTPIQEDDDVVKISTNLIQIDVTVTDKKGNVIKDLKPEEIEIYENGKKQNISNFTFISNVREQNQAVNNKNEKNAPPIPVPPARVRPGQIRRTIALVVDDLTLSFASTYWVQQALKKFVNEQMQDGDLVAIIRTGAGVGALQQFTTDRRQLIAAIDKVRFNLAGAGKIGIFNPIEPSLKEELDGTENSDGSVNDYSEEIEAERNFEREANDFRESIFASGTLGALNFIIRGMQDLPGRKSVVLLSDGFRLFVRDDRGNAQASRIFDSLRRLTDLANRASVVVYTIDARGLVAPGLSAEDNVAGLSFEQIEQRMTDRRNELFDTQEGLTYLARQTGGFPVINNNDISRGIRRVLDDQSYYLIGYQPDDETFDPKTRRFNKLEVKVKREDARVRYRSGFFGITDDQIQKPQQLPAQQAILNALTSPFAVNDINLNLNALFDSDAKQGAFVRSYVHINSKDLKFTREADGSYKAVFDLVAVSFGDNGTISDELAKNYTFVVKEDAYPKILEKGFVYYFAFPVKKPGGYQMRIALRDTVTGKVGSANQFIEVPNLKKNRLTISGIVLENMTFEQWQKMFTDAAAYQEIKKMTDPLTDTSLRQFKQGTVLRFGFEIYNAIMQARQNPNLTTQVRIFRDGKIFFEGKQTPLEIANQQAADGIASTGNLRLGEQMPPGEYILQIVVTDNLAKKKRQIASQSIAFEIVP